MVDILLEQTAKPEDTKPTGVAKADDADGKPEGEETTDTTTDEPGDDSLEGAGELGKSDETAVDDASAEDDSLPEAEYLRQFELPGKFDKVEDVISAYKESLAEMKRSQTEAQKVKQLDEQLKRAGLEGGLAALETELQERIGGGGAPARETKIEGNNFRDLIVSSVKNGDLSQEQAEGMIPYAHIFDGMFQKMFDALGQTVQSTKKGIGDIQSGLRDNELWTSFAGQYKGIGPEDRVKLRSVKAKHNFDTYEQAYAWGKVEDPAFLKNIVAKAEADAKANGLKRLRLDTRPGQDRRGGGGGVNLTLRSFADPDGTINTDAILKAYRQNKLSKAQYKKFMDEATRLSGAS